MKTPLQLITLRWPLVAALLVLSATGFAPLVRAEAEPGRDAALARCLKLLQYGEIHGGLGKPTKVDAVVALGLLGDESVVPVLVEHLKNEGNDHLRLQIVRALGWIGGKAIVPALEEAARRDTYVHVRNLATATLKGSPRKDQARASAGEAEMLTTFSDLVRPEKAAPGKRVAPAAPNSRGTP